MSTDVYNSTSPGPNWPGLNVTAPAENYRFIPGQVATRALPKAGDASKQPPSNVTGFFIEDEVEPGLSDIQTLFLACIATFTPLIISLLIGFGLRLLWRKYRRYRECNNYLGNVIQEENSAQPLSGSLCSHLLNEDQVKSETQLSICPEDESNAMTNSVTNGPQISKPANHSNSNGSIITMTLKNNHLIVETEERNDIEEDSRETTMKYSPSARNGVFVVEVQQGGRRSPGSSANNQRAIIHNPPEKYEEVEPPGKRPGDLKTGLTQSDLSLNSSSHYGYYGNQKEYECNCFADSYPSYRDCTAQARPTNNRKPKIISEIYKMSFDMRASIDDGALLSDVMLREVASRASPELRP